MTAFKFRMNAGVPGDVSRHESAKVEANVIDGTTPPTRYGDPVKMNSGKIKPIESGNVAADVYGLYVRPFPSNSGSDPLGTSTPPTSGIGDVLKSGYIVVKLEGSAAATRNGVVYVRKSTGHVEAAADSTNTFVLANSYFTGAADASGNVEVAYNL